MESLLNQQTVTSSVVQNLPQLLRGVHSTSKLQTSTHPNRFNQIKSMKIDEPDYLNLSKTKHLNKTERLDNPNEEIHTDPHSKSICDWKNPIPIGTILSNLWRNIVQKPDNSIPNFQINKNHKPSFVTNQLANYPSIKVNIDIPAIVDQTSSNDEKHNLINFPTSNNNHSSLSMNQYYPIMQSIYQKINSDFMQNIITPMSTSAVSNPNSNFNELQRLGLFNLLWQTQLELLKLNHHFNPLDFSKSNTNQNQTIDYSNWLNIDQSLISNSELKES